MTEYLDHQNAVAKYGADHVVVSPAYLSKNEMCLTTTAVLDSDGESAYVACAYIAGHRSPHSWALERGAKSSMNPHTRSTRDFAAAPGSGRVRTVEDPEATMSDVRPAPTPRTVKKLAESV